MVQCWLVELLRRFVKTVRLSLVLFLALLMLAASNLPPGDQLQKVRSFTRQTEFDFIGWTAHALKLKLFEAAGGVNGYLTESERQRIVYDYLSLVRQIQNKENEVKEIYANPDIADPGNESASLRGELSTLHARREEVAGLAESILQSQIARILDEVGLSLGGQAVPPVLYHSSPLPHLLVTSPREVIRLEESVALVGDLTVDQQVELENNIERALNISALVETIGGLGLYPTMVVQSSDLAWLSEVVAHEWVHNYLTLRPLGILYESSPEMRVINETVASIAGKEISTKVLERYYPLDVPTSPSTTAQPENGSEPDETPKFDFRREMNITRLHADRLLEAGKIQEAEDYMEQRREIFWENGYKWLRRLNQAYFAFHGAYADEPGGASGSVEDPIGSTVRELRAQSGSLAQFLKQASWITSYADLQQMVSKGS